MGIIKLSDQNFQETVQSGITLIDFFAEWCGPCKMVAPIIEELANEEQDVKIAKADVDTCQQLAMQHQITSVPTMVLYKDGKEVNRLLGVKDKEALKSFIASAR